MIVAEFLDDLGHSRGCFGVWAPDWYVLVHCLAVDGLKELQVVWVCGGGGVLGGWGEEVLVADGGDEGYNLDVVRQLEVFLGDGAGGDTTWSRLLG